ncbi:MAG: hypothetical protein ACOCQH_00575 [Halanaerobiales bacterium]
MQKLILYLLIFLISIMLVACSRPVEKVGILDMERVLEESQRAQKLQQELHDIGNRLESEYQQQEEELSNGEEELERIYQEYQNNKQRLEGDLNSEIKEVIAGIADNENLGTVIFKDSVYYGGVDITDEVISGLDTEEESEVVKGDGRE